MASPEESTISEAPRTPLAPGAAEKPQAKESFSLLKGYLKGTLTSEEKGQFEERIIKTGNLDILFPAYPELLGAYYHASLRPIDLLTIDLEMNVGEGKLDPIGVQFLLALRLIEPGKQSLLRMCEIVRRTLRYNVPKRTFRAEKWQHDRALSTIQEMDAALRRYEDFTTGESLLDVYREYYEKKPYDDVLKDSSFTEARDQDREMQIFTGHERLTLGSIRDIMATANPRTQETVLKFLLGKYADGLLRDQIMALITQCSTAIRSPEHAIMVLSFLRPAFEQLPQNQRGPLANSLKKNLVGTLTKYAAERGNLWKTFVFWQIYGAKEEMDDVDQEMNRKIFQELPSSHADRFAEEFMKENNVMIALRCLPKAPDATKSTILQKILSHKDALDQPALRKKLAVLLRISESHDSRFQFFIIGNPAAESDEGLQEILGKAEAILKIAGRDNVKIQTFCEGIRVAQAAEIERQRAELERRQRRASGAIKKALEESVPKRKPGELSDEEFAERLRKKLASLHIPTDIGFRVPALRELQGRFEESVLEFLGNEAALDEIFGTNGVKEIPCEKDSLLRKFGIRALKFRRTRSFDIECVFEDHGGEIPLFYPRLHLDDVGNFSMHGIPHDLRWLEAIFKTEVMRLFGSHGKEEKVRAEERDTALVLLGLKEYAPPTLEPSPVTSPELEAAPPPEAPTEDPAVTRTREFLEENFQTFEACLRALGTASIIPGSFRDLADTFYQRQATTRVNKALTPGGIQVIPREGSHVLAPYITRINFYSVPESRQMFKQLGILPSYFHVESDSFDAAGELDAYLGVVQLKLPGEEERTIHICILPPRFDVYVIGVDPQNHMADQDKGFVAFLHVILESFRTAVMREDDPMHHAPGLPGPATGTPWVLRVRRVVRDVTQAEYPPIVVEWQPLTRDEREDDGGIDRGQGPRRRGRGSREIFVEEIFEDLYSAIGQPESKLASRGIFLQGGDLVRVLPALASVFPAEAWTRAHGGRELKNGYNDLYIPLDSIQNVQDLLSILQTKTILEGTRTSTDPLAWFRQEMESPGQKSAGEIFGSGLNTQFLRTDAYFQRKSRSLFAEQSKRIPNYRALFERVLQESQKDDPSVTTEDVFRAFVSMSVLNPEKVFLATSGACDWRLPYLFRRGRDEMPNEKIFRDSDFTVEAGTPTQVVEIIAGNRARMASVSDSWLRGSFRTHEIDLAAGIQNRYQNSTSGREISLAPRARALLVWEFVDGMYAFTYLDAARDTIARKTLAAIPGTQRLLSFPRVRHMIQLAEAENRSRNHTDFQDLTRWSQKELERLEEDGVLGLQRDGVGRIIGIAWAKPIKRKKIAVFTEEQIGYKQFQLEPSNLGAYQKFGRERGVDIGLNLSYDPKIAIIQKRFYDLLEI